MGNIVKQWNGSVNLNSKLKHKGKQLLSKSTLLTN